MKPVHQSKLAIPDASHRGNCFAACLASMLEVPLWMVPPFEGMFDRPDWSDRVDEWVERLFYLRRVRTDGHAVDAMPEFYIASGLSPRGVRHSVIYSKGTLIHDPHPSGAGITAVEFTWHFEAMPA